MSSRSATGYHLTCTGQALDTANAHSSPASIKLMGACFCPFVQRAWIALELLRVACGEQAVKQAKLDYEYFEIDPYKKPKELLEVSPKGLVPAIILEDGRSLHDSVIIMHYLSSIQLGSGENPLLPSDPFLRAKHLLAGQRHSETITPAFYRYLQAQEPEKQADGEKELIQAWEQFESEMDKEGPFFLGKELGWVDVLIAPWAVRIKPVLEHYRSFKPPIITDSSRRFHRWFTAIMEHPAVKATTSTDELYTDSYHRYAQNLPMTSQVADATNKGRALP